MFNIKWGANNDLGPRLGIVISKKTAKLATVRNRVRRRIRAICHGMFETADANFDIIISVKQAALSKSFEELESNIKEAFRKAKFLK